MSMPESRRTNLTAVEGAMHLACLQGNAANVSAFLKRGAYVDSRCGEMTLLMAAASRGLIEVIKVALDAGADVNARMASTNDTPLTLAARTGQTEAVKQLIDRGADLYAATNGGLNALITASWKGNIEVVSVLLDLGMRPDEPSEEGVTALMMAARNGNTGVAKLLIAAGADVNARTVGSMTPLRYAKKYRQNDVANVLRQAGAIDLPQNKKQQVTDAILGRFVTWLEHAHIVRR